MDTSTHLNCQHSVLPVPLAPMLIICSMTIMIGIGVAVTSVHPGQQHCTLAPPQGTNVVSYWKFKIKFEFEYLYFMLHALRMIQVKLCRSLTCNL